MNLQNINALGTWGSRHLKLLLIVFGVALIAKAGVLSRGFAVDDYSFGQGFTQEDVTLFMTQGRFLLGVIDWVINSLNVNINDIYVSLGFFAIFLQAAVVVAMLRFVGAADSPWAALVGSLIVVHPYLAELLTFRMVLPGYCIAAIFSIVALEAVALPSNGYRAWIVALTATVGMLFVYQGFLNYFAVAIVFAYLFGVLQKKLELQHKSGKTDLALRAFTLTCVCTFSAFLFLLILSVSKKIGLIQPTGRANFIEWREIPFRLEQIRDLLLKVYWGTEAVSPSWLKIIIAIMVSAALSALIPGFAKGLQRSRFSKKTFGVVFAVALLIPVTVGVILPFKDWWPVPRVLPQVPLILGLLLLLAYPACRERYGKLPIRVLAASIGSVILAFIFINNQIFADQQRLNSWDKMEANRIIARFELQPNFLKIDAIYVGGGSWRHGGKLNTIQGDMNISAFSPDYSKVPLLVEVSGYNFKKASGNQISVGENYCATALPWPDALSVAIIDNLAIVCLKK